jgi:hypothetical protein
MTSCAPDTALGLNALTGGRILVAPMAPCLGLMDANGEPVWTVGSRILDFRDQADVMRASEDGHVVDFGYEGSARPALRFGVKSLTLSTPQPNDGLMFAPNREGLRIDGWRNGASPTLDGRALPLERYERARNLAIAADSKRFFFLGSNFALTEYDGRSQKWRRSNRSEISAVNASKDGRVVVTASYDGAILASPRRWARASRLACPPEQRKRPD